LHACRKDTIEKNFRGAADVVARVTGIVQAFLDDVTGSLRAMKDTLIDLVVKAVGGLIANLVVSVLGGVGLVKKLCQLMFGIAKLCDDLGEMVTAFADSLVDLAQGGGGVIGRIANRVKGVLTKAIRPMLTILLAGLGLGRLVENIQKLFSKIAKTIGTFVMKAWKALFDLIKRVIGGKGDGDGGGGDGTCKIGNKNSGPVGQSGALGPNASAMISPAAYEQRVCKKIEPTTGKNTPNLVIPANQSVDRRELEIDCASKTYYTQVKRWGCDKPKASKGEINQFDRTFKQAKQDGKKFAIAFPPHVSDSIKQTLIGLYPGLTIFDTIDPF